MTFCIGLATFVVSTGYVPFSVLTISNLSANNVAKSYVPRDASAFPIFGCQESEIEICVLTVEPRVDIELYYKLERVHKMLLLLGVLRTVFFNIYFLFRYVPYSLIYIFFFFLFLFALLLFALENLPS